MQASEAQNTQELDAGEIIAATDGLAETPIPPQEPPLQEPFQMQYDAAVEPTLDVEPPEPEEPILSQNRNRCQDSWICFRSREWEQLFRKMQCIQSRKSLLIRSQAFPC